MAVTCGFFNALEHDRLYDAIQMSSIFDGIIRDGIFSTIGTSMAVTASGTGLVVNVGAGRAWFNHTWILNDTLYPVEAETAEVVLDRIDALVIEVNQSAEVRDCSIKFVKGTPSSRPVRPTMTHNAEVNQYALAYISIRAGQTTIFQADITSVIGNDETPFVTGLLQQTSIESIVAQWQDEFYTYFNNFRSTTASDFNTWMAARVAEYNAWYASMEAEGQADLAEFDSWFQEMKDQLSEDAAGHLQAEIDALELSAEKGSVVIVTTSDDTLINHACTISQGSSERNATFDINKTATFESIPFVGNMHITATNGTMIASKDINIPYFGRYNYDLEFWEATLAISSSSTELYERPITITKGGTTVGTTSFDNTGHATFKVHEPGTYTVTSTTTGGAVFTANVEVTAETSYPVDLGTPIGRTALPTDDIQLWLKCGGEYNVTYTTLAEVLADTELFARLCADSNACDYMARSTTWALNSGEVPTLSSDTGSNGQCVKSTAQNNFPAYYAFDNNDSTKWRSSSGTNEYLGYHFDTPVVINKVTFKSEQDSFIRLKNYEIRGSNDNFATYETLASGTYANNVHIEEVTFNNTTAYSDYCIYCIDHYSTTAYGFSIVSLQFYQSDITTNSTAMQIVGMFDYCAEALISNETWCEALINSDYWQSVFNDSIPKMTSNTTPSGVASMSGTVYQGVEAYHSFNQSTQSGAMIYTELPCWIKYEFPNPITVCKITYKECGNSGSLNPNSFWTRGKFQGSNDDTNWTDIYDIEQTVVLGKTYTYTFFNDTPYKYYRIYVTATAGSFSYFQFGGFMNFYGRTKTVEYTPLVPTMTSNTTPSGEVTSTTPRDSNYPAWQAFDGNDSTQFQGNVQTAVNSNGSGYIQYHFQNPVSIKRMYVKTLSNMPFTSITVSISDDDTNFTPIKTYTTSIYDGYIDISDNDTTCTYVKVQTTQKNSTSATIYLPRIYTVQFYGISEGITIHSAANDTIYYLDGSTPVTVAVTDTNGKAVIDTEDLDPGTYTLYSTVAKDPNNLSNAYTKTVKINGNTTEIYLMPIMSLYWWGYKDANCESISTENDWSKSGSWASYAFVNPTYNTIDVTFAGTSSQLCGIGANTTTSSISKVHAITQGIIITNGSGGVMGCTTTKTFPLGANIDIAATDTTVKHVTYTPQSPLSNSRAVAYLNDTRSYKLYALWYE